MSESNPVLEPCPVCFQDPPKIPTKLPCSHTFCFLCAKGAVLQNRKCPLCRHRIGISYFDNPQIVTNIDQLPIATFDEQYHWFYEGRSGWWLYDDTTSQIIEEEFKRKSQNYCEVLIAGFIYVINFEKMIQYRKDNPRNTRKIKRDLFDAQQVKGVAGLRP